MIDGIKNRVLGLYEKIKLYKGMLRENPRVKQAIAFGEDILARSRADKKVRNRFLIIGIGSLLFFDYLMFCYHTDKNIFDIFPTIPVMKDTREIEVFLPALDGKTVFTEKREVVEFSSDERFVQYLLNTVRSGSRFENTSLMVPVELHVRDIWIIDGPDTSGEGKICVVDLEVPVMEKNVQSLPGSEALFRQAFRQTVIANIPAIKDVLLLERGIPGKKLWDVAVQD